MAMPNFDLKGRVAFVTGATSGLGRQFALCLAQAGARLVISGRREDRLAALKAEIEAVGGEALPIAFDVTDLAAASAAVARVEEEFGPIWCLVNNSGIVISKRTVNHTQEDYDAVLDTNLRAPFYLCQEVGRAMIERDMGGRIINISSMGAFTPLKGGITYSMSKSAMVMMTKCLALEWARHGIRVNAICPGYIRTEMNGAYFDSEPGQKDIASWTNRRLGSDTDLNGLLLLLASDESDFINGSIMQADDAQSLRAI